MRWLAHYDPGVPRTLAPYPEKTLLDVAADTARLRPDHPVLYFKGAEITAERLERLSDAFAAALADLGVGRGDRVALVLPNCPQFVIAELGAWKAGAVLVPLNPLYGEDELAGPLVTTGATVAVALTPFYPRLKRVQARTPVRLVVATGIKEYLPAHLRALFTLFKEGKEGHRVRLAPGDRWFADLLRTHAGARRPAAAVRPGDPAMILLSGGTTGTPKGVVAPHRSFVIAGLQERAWYGDLAREWQERIVLPLPLFHSYGCLGVQTLAFVTRSTLALVPNPRDLDDLLATIRRVRPTFFVGVPTLYNALLRHPEVRAGRADFRSMKTCVSGAAPLLLETRRRFEALTGGTLVEGYSMTEALLASAVNPVRGPHKEGSVGIPLPDVEMKVVDAEEGERELPPGEVGEILIRAPQVMPGYWNDPEETARTLRPHGEGRPWLHTGDLGTMDEEGYLFVVDRKKDLIKVGGLQVWPREIEEVVAAHPAVAEVGVAGVPDAARGEAVKAWVVVREGMSLTEAELRAFCKDRLAPFKAPALVEFRKDLPKSPLVGKVLRRALVADHRPGPG
ncbi:MAG TPA: AMP-binding protein [Vicinamibacteria bacterium]|nr:AMP-binding protein [Vicinamibacteria bacterium]